MKKLIPTLLALSTLSISSHLLAGHHYVGPDHDKHDQQSEKLSVEQRAMKALQTHLSLPDKSGMSVIKKQEKNWPDTSLGCPKPGFMYPQMIVPGALVKVSLKGEIHHVHLSDKRALVCKQDKKALSTGAKKIKPKKLQTLNIEALTLRAKAHLGGLIGAKPESINVVSTKPYDWPDSALGCPKPGASYTKATVKGYRILLSVNGKRYTYHTDSSDRFIPCPEIATQ